ncbi:MAG: ATP-binding cassette domain-containing protein [Spirochaetales bacterium]|nr:ATP-binding cassette domain-containing protein [Spirochaetales bacterium]
MNKGFLQIKNLKFSYPTYEGYSSTEILKGISLDIRPGSINIIFGGSESGKTTLALILSALIPNHTGGEISGEVRIDDIDILNAYAPELIEHCGIVFQDPEKQTVTTDCFSEAAFALESMGIPVEEIDKRVKKSFSSLGIEKLLKAKITETSGGEKKKLGLACLFAVNPDLYILDETMEELDNSAREKLFKLLKKTGKSVIIFSSKFYNIFETADTFSLLQDGELLLKESFPLSPYFKNKLEEEGIIADLKLLSTNKDNKENFEDLLISAENIVYSYSDNGFALNIEGFSLFNGEVVSLVGRNGCGKSTFAKILCGLINPSAGEIKVENKTAESVFLNSFCAYLFQNPDYQIFLPTIFDELSWGMKECGIANRVIKASVSAAIEDFCLPQEDTPPAMMSFSARKRLQAGVYYLLKRPVFILDEADTSLSYIDFIDLVERIKTVCKSVIIITHDLKIASAVSDRVIGMDNGCFIEDLSGLPSELLEQWFSDSSEKGKGLSGDPS